jgi:cobalt-precorrin-5B (C1)-methyltransferase
MVTRPGLPIPPGEPAINPVPRRMMAEVIGGGDAEITIAVENGEALAAKTLNPRLGIVGGLSILGTTGIVVPYSCAAWIDTIHRGIDVARALCLPHVAGATGSTSEAAIQARHSLSDPALIDMGDFVGGMLKYLRRHPVEKVSIAGGIGKMTKLAQGRLDLHSKRGSVDLAALAALAALAGGDAALSAAITAGNTALEAFQLAEAAGVPLGDAVAQAAWTTAAHVIAGSGIALEVVVFDRAGQPVGHAPFRVV